ncbi:MAG: hypothetical protein EAZ07_07635 [Cytophagales bacterium]|nr:MAG: hypothetical protein EAZ07_07635 [Cytophagales bacterium]
MSKLKNIIKQLSLQDFNSIYTQLVESNAEKSAFLLKFLREKQLSDTKIMEELEVNTNAYYTLRSRLNQKIEEFLLQQMESPRTTLIKKVSTIHEIIYTKKKTIAIATLKKLEKELLDYDMSNELTIVYKSLKKLLINTSDHYVYSQLYNKHVAYMLALDKAEDVLADYFKKAGNYFLTKDETEKMGLVLLSRELENISNLYQSHRLYVYLNCLKVYHIIYFSDTIQPKDNDETIEQIIDKVEKIFEQYYLDATYYHLKVVFEFLKLQYYTHNNQFRKAEKYYDEINNSMNHLITNFNLFSFSPYLMLLKLERHYRLETENTLYEENKILFEDFEIDKNNIPQYIIYASYRAICCFNIGKYEEASRWLNNLLNDLSLKKHPQTLVEIKVFLSLQYCMTRDLELFNQLINSIQRQVRIIGKENCLHVLYLIKIMKTIINEYKKGKTPKVNYFLSKINKNKPQHFSPINYIQIDDSLISRINLEL